jgi:hypothetical protein
MLKYWATVHGLYVHGDAYVDDGTGETMGYNANPSTIKLDLVRANRDGSISPFSPRHVQELSFNPSLR